jgi:hypothetical protein
MKKSILLLFLTSLIINVNAQVINNFINYTGAPNYNGDTSNPVTVLFNKVLR